MSFTFVLYHQAMNNICIRYMLTQQTARYLMKTFRTIFEKRDEPSNGSVTMDYIKAYLVCRILLLQERDAD